MCLQGRLAMLGFLTALLSEISTGTPVMAQLEANTVPIVGVAAAFAVASLIPMLKGGNLSQAVGPFNAEAELLNG